MKARQVVVGVHVLLAAVHVYWATGATWPAIDQRSLSQAVLGQEVSFAPQVVLPLAALHVVLAVAVLKVDSLRLARLLVAGLAAGLAVRTAAGLVWDFGLGTDSGTAFYWLNLFFYTPACITLLAVDLRLLRTRQLTELAA